MLKDDLPNGICWLSSSHADVIHNLAVVFLVHTPSPNKGHEPESNTNTMHAAVAEFRTRELDSSTPIEYVLAMRQRRQCTAQCTVLESQLAIAVDRSSTTWMARHAREHGDLCLEL